MSVDFAAAARPHYGDVFVAMNLQVDAAQRNEPLPSPIT